MAAEINQTPSSSDTPSNYRRPELLYKVDGQIARIIKFLILDNEEGFIIISEDKSLRILLKRDNGQFWPSVIEYLPNLPTCLFLHETARLLFVGLVSGAVYQYEIREDWNSLELIRRYNVHTNAVTGIAYSHIGKELFSCSRDKTLIWHSADSGNKIGMYNLGCPCSVIQFDSSTNFAFIGDANGNVYVLRINGVAAQLVSKLSAHTGAITDLAWDSTRQLLFSASTDTLVIMWDIGGKQGQCYELNGHDSKLSAVVLGANKNKLFSVDETGHLMCWDLNAKRIMAPAWKDSDNCQLCDVPFFWNVKVMWERKVVGVRRHHCRTCGTSVCDNCCNYRTIFPAMGFEKPARICRTCKKKMEEYPEKFDLTPLATISELRQGVVDMRLHKDGNKLATIGYDRTILLWDILQVF
ncbi:unnamed protein product [Bursaphelenchus okinawaensis]|uniref:FYVE-type domain-containing protein n=1 Tax=Bursaphelenchus okinawaensis TaxID=465554 RepID=A0A811K806_9BILA|nr:unnamed protein product [Bursaphelenchus okinawaensis]CAG9093670.1 unnamed protein product [Bursaphelenchus okinawaensis]